MNSIKKQLGSRIKEIRKHRGITQEQLAEMVGIGTSNISYIETGKFAPSIENFEKIVKALILKALNVEPYELYMFNPIKSIDEMKKEIKTAIEDENVLNLIYKFYLAIKH